MSASAANSGGGAPAGGGGYGLPTLVALVVTGMIGSGVFTTSGFALESLGSPAAVLAAWLVGGLVACCGAVAYAALAFRLPQSGGEYLYLSRSLHPFAGFLAGMVSLTAGFSGAIAFAALTCQAYARPLLSLPGWLPPQAPATAVVLACGLLHLEAGRLAARLNTGLVALKMLAIGGLIIWGYTAILGDQHAAGEVPVASAGLSIGSFATTVMWIMFSYTGFNEAVYIASEARSPRRTVPRAVLLGTLLVTAIYWLLNDVFLRSTAAADLAGQAEVAAVAAAALGGPRFEWWMRLAIVLSTFSAAAGMTMAGSRVAVAMADDQILPRWLAGPAGRSRAVLVQAALAMGLVQLATIRSLLGYLGVTLSLCSALTVTTLLLPGARQSNDGRASVAVLAAAGIYVAITLAFAVLMCLHDPWQLAGTVTIVVVSGLGFGLFRARGNQGQIDQDTQ